MPGNTDPAAPAAARPAESIGFDTLVDSIARARDGMADGAPVAIALRHAEFGRVSLRFQPEADGLSVAMASLDPAFAPAVAAAHAAEAAAAAAMTAEAAPRVPQAGAANDTTGGGQIQGQMQGQMQGSAQGGTGQRHEAPGQPRAASNAARLAPRSGEARADDSRGGIFA